MTLPLYGSSPTLEGDVGDAGLVMQTEKFWVHRQISACNRRAGGGVEQPVVEGTDVQEQDERSGIDVVTGAGE